MKFKVPSKPDTGEKPVEKKKKGFQKGVSGNPNGRPKGARNKLTLLAEALLEEEGEAIIRRMIERALENDDFALRLCWLSIVPPMKDRPISFTLPPIETPQDIVDASAEVIAAVSDGTITPSEGQVVMALLEVHCKTIEVAELASRLDRLEKDAGLVP